MDFLAVDTFHSVRCVCKVRIPTEGVRGCVCQRPVNKGWGHCFSVRMLQALGSCDRSLDLSSLRLGPHPSYGVEIVPTSSKLCNSVRSLCEPVCRELATNGFFLIFICNSMSASLFRSSCGPLLKLQFLIDVTFQSFLDVPVIFSEKGKHLTFLDRAFVNSLLISHLAEN